MSSTSWVFEGSNGSPRIPIRSRLTVTTAEAAIGAAIGAAVAGLGVTRVLSYQVVEALKETAIWFACWPCTSRPLSP